MLVGHGWHNEPSIEKVPAGQYVQSVRFAKAWVPHVHELHDVLPSAVENDPSAHN